ncbi:MAG: hypothetical protein ACOC33_02120 [bacterium]
MKKGKLISEAERYFNEDDYSIEERLIHIEPIMKKLHDDIDIDTTEKSEIVILYIKLKEYFNL